MRKIEEKNNKEETIEIKTQLGDVVNFIEIIIPLITQKLNGRAIKEWKEI